MSNEFSHRDRIKYLILGVLAGTTLIIARFLRPSPQGVGTHEQLGLPPCPFLHLTGIPCPSCGLTTSFAHAARLNFYEAFVTQPFGLITFCLAIVSIPLSFYLIRRRVLWSDIIHARFFDSIMYAMIVLFVLSWVYKVIVMKWLSAVS